MRDIAAPHDCSLPEDVDNLTDIDSALGESAASPDSARKTHSGCSSMSDRDEENFECFGEGDEGELDSDSARPGSDEADGVPHQERQPHSLPPSSNGSTSVGGGGVGSTNFGRRNSWMRRSLRTSPSSSPGKRAATAAVASQLYRTSSFNSSGRSSTADQDDMYSDNSIEDDVHDLNHKVQMLQQQVGVLAENQINTDDRYSRVRQDNAALQAKVVMLEEQSREAELRADERLTEEQRRSRELMSRVEREKQLQIENYTIRLATLEKEKTHVEDSGRKLKVDFERITKDKVALEDRLSEAEFSASGLSQENGKLADLCRREKDEIKVERERTAQVIEELRCEVERLRLVEESVRKRSPSNDASSAQTQELQSAIKALRDENKNLQEQVEDLQAQLLTSRLEEGRVLVNATNNNSLAAEFEQMTSEEATHLDTIEKVS